MEKKAYLMPPDLLKSVKQEIPRTVSVAHGYKQVVETGLSKFTSVILPKFDDEKFREEISSIKMTVESEDFAVRMWLFFETRKSLDGLADKLKSARDVLRKKHFKTKCFTYHVLVAIFRAWLAGEFTVNFKGR